MESLLLRSKQAAESNRPERIVSQSSNGGCSAEFSSCDENESGNGEEKDYETRLQHTYNATAATTAARNGDWDTFNDLMASDSTLTQHASDRLIFNTVSLLSNDRHDSPDQAIRTAQFDQFGSAKLNVDTIIGPEVWEGEAFTIRVKFSLPHASKECCENNLENDARVTANSIFELATKVISPTRKRSGVEFYVSGLTGYADITMRMPRDTEGGRNKVRLFVQGTLKTWRQDKNYRGQATIALEFNPSRRFRPGGD